MALFARKQRRWKRGLLVFLAGYVVAHFALSRSSLRMVRRDWGIDEVFLYLPVKPDLVADHGLLHGIHLALLGFFYPMWMLDQHLPGGPWPMRSMLELLLIPSIPALNCPLPFSPTSWLSSVNLMKTADKPGVPHFPGAGDPFPVGKFAVKRPERSCASPPGVLMVYVL